MGSCHCNVFDDEWPAHKSVSVLEKRSREHFGKTEMLLLVTSQSVKMNGRQYASLLKKLFLVVKYHLIAIFQLYGLLQLSLSKLCRFIQL